MVHRLLDFGLSIAILVAQHHQHPGHPLGDVDGAVVGDGKHARAGEPVGEDGDLETLRRADLMDTAVGQQEKDDPAEVARQGFDAMMQGRGEVVSGWKNRLQVALASVMPSGMLAEKHRKQAEPGSAKRV